MEAFSFFFSGKPGERPPSVSNIIGKEMAYRVLLNSSGVLAWVIATENNAWYSSGTSISGSTSLTAGEWHHVVAGYDGESTFLYLDGRLEAKSGETFSGRVVNSSTSLTMAKGNTTNVQSFTGALDDVRYFLYMLSDSSVNRLYRLYPIPDTSYVIPTDTIPTDTIPTDTITPVTGYINAHREVVVYPNPAGEKVLISRLSPSCRISLFSVEGQLLREEQAEVSPHTLDVSSLPQGLYLLVFRDEGTLFYRKLLIDR